MSPNSRHNYSGMIPAHMAGIYPLDACGIDLRPWAERIGARFLECAATGLDADRRVVFRLCNPFSVNFRLGGHNTWVTD